MSFFVKETRARVQKLEDKGNYSVVNLSTSRKKERDSNEYIYSDWGFVRFVGKAHAYLQNMKVEKGDILVIKNAAFSREPYTKDEKKTWPKSAQLVVFDCEVYRKGSNQTQQETGVQESSPVEEDDNIPF